MRMSDDELRARSRSSRPKGIVRRKVQRRLRTNRGTSENGDTLIEVLMALLVLGLAGVALIGAFTTVIGASSEHRTLSTNDVVLKDFAESATYQIQLQQPAPLYLPFFLPCATLTGTATNASPNMTYSNGVTSHTISFTPPMNYSVQVTQVQILFNNTTFQTTTTFPSSGCDSTQDWPQLITATATGPKGSASLSFVVSDPMHENYVSPTSTTTTTTTIPPTTTTTTVPKKLHVSSMSAATDGVQKSWDALVTIDVVDTNGTAVAGVAVSGSWSKGVATSTTSCTTGVSGTCQVEDGVSQNLGASVKSDTFTVSGLVLSGYTYDVTANFASPASKTVGQP